MKPKAVILLAVALVLAIAAIGIVWQGRPEPAPPRVTEDETAQFITEQLNGHLLNLTKKGSEVAIESDGKYGIGDWAANDRATWRTNFLLPRGGTFQRAPDHHISLSFRIEEIGEKSVRISYTHRYSHPMPNGRGTDTGKVSLAYFKDREPSLKKSW